MVVGIVRDNRKYVVQWLWLGKHIKWEREGTAVSEVKHKMFRDVRKIAKSNYYLRHVCLSVCTENLGPQSMDFHDI